MTRELLVESREVKKSLIVVPNTHQVAGELHPTTSCHAISMGSCWILQQSMAKLKVGDIQTFTGEFLKEKHCCRAVACIFKVYEHLKCRSDELFLRYAMDKSKQTESPFRLH